MRSWLPALLTAFKASYVLASVTSETQTWVNVKIGGAWIHDYSAFYLI
jgi:hypothetical protein